MGLIKDTNYITLIGIKEKIYETEMGNTIYILNNRQKYKEFGEDYRNLSESINREYRDTLSIQTESYAHDLIAFPQVVIATENELYGIIGDYIDGIPLSELDQETNLDYLLYIIEYLERKIIEASESGWNLEDLHEDNIIINKDNQNQPVKIIDPDFYTLKDKSDDFAVTQAYRRNLCRLFRSIIHGVLPEFITSGNLYERLEKEYWQSCDGNYLSSTFIKDLIIKSGLRTEKEQNIKTLRKTL